MAYSRRLALLQVFEQFFRIRILGCKLKRLFQFAFSQIRFFLLEVNARQCGAHGRGVANSQGGLQLPHGIVEFAAPPKDLRQPVVR